MSQANLAFQKLVWDFCKYTPSAEQQAFHRCPARLKLAAGGVGAGKSYCTARELDKFSSIPNGLGWIIGPTYDLAKPEFEYLYDVYADLGIVKTGRGDVQMGSRGQRRFVTEWGFEWMTKSATDIVGIAGRRPDVIAVTEAAQHPQEMYYKSLERATEKDAPIIFSGTFEGSFGWYAEQWARWKGSNPEKGKSFSIPTWSNVAVYPGGRTDPKILSIEATMPAELFQERYGGIPCKPSGLVYKEYERVNHCKQQVELYNPLLPVELWVDPATHCYAILFVQVQADGRTVHVLDELYAKNQIAQQVIPQIVKHWLWPQVKSGVIDTSGNTRAMGGMSQIEVWATELRRLATHTVDWHFRYWLQDQKRNAIHLRLYSPEDAKPLLYFSDTLNDRLEMDGSANGILGELKTHRWADRDERAGQPSNPIKRNSDALDALGYGLLHHFGPVVKRQSVYKRILRAYA